MPASSPAPTTNWKNAICHKCGGKGHIARVCPSQRDETDQANFVVDNTTDNEEANNYAF
jgi:hypothetical protein